MSSIFKKPTIQAPAPAAPAEPAPVLEAPPVPTIDEAAKNQDAADRIRKRRGRLATMLVPNNFGAAVQPQTLGG